MATKDDIATRYKNRIVTVINESYSDVPAEKRRTEKEKKALKEFKEIWVDLDTYTISGSPLTESVKKEILTKTGEKLGLKKPEKMFVIVKEASNDNFIAMANFWDEFFADFT